MKIFLTITCTILYTFSFAQLHDNNWMTGGHLNNDNVRMIFDFRETPVEVTLIPNGALNLRVTSTSYSDYYGNLLFYFNGTQIANKAHQIMENGEGINPGNNANIWGFLGYIALQGGYFLPLPDNDSLLYLFHQPFDTNPILGKTTNKVLHSIINQNANQNLGKVLEKNLVTLNETPTEYSIFSVVRHANGRDWWILTPDYVENRYYRQLFSPNGVGTPLIQDIGDKIVDTVRTSCNKLFSPDGSKYVNYDVRFGFDVYDFDRCSGLLSNSRRVNFPDYPLHGGGAAFSPNNRFLYVSTHRIVVQYDLEAPDLTMSADTIAKIDSLGFCAFADPFPEASGFSMMSNGIDGYIYVHNSNLQSNIHIIYEPDSLGSACQIEKCGFELPFSTNRAYPHFPNYRLYDLPDSPCDTLGIDGPPDPPEPPIATEERGKEQKILKTYPNPASDELVIELPNPSKSGDKILIYNNVGQRIETITLSAHQTKATVDVKDYANSLYFAQFVSNEKVISTTKVIINH